MAMVQRSLSRRTFARTQEFIASDRALVSGRRALPRHGISRRRSSRRAHRVDLHGLYVDRIVTHGDDAVVTAASRAEDGELASRSESLMVGTCCLDRRP